MARSEPTWRPKDAAREVAVSPRQRNRRRERRNREKENRTLGSDGAIVVLTGRYARAADTSK